MSKTIEQWFEEYGESHQNPTNKRIHFVCVPTIFFSLIGLFSYVSISSLTDNLNSGYAFFISLASVIIILILVFYIRLSLSIAIGMLIVSLISLLFNYLIYTSGIIPLWLFSSIIFVLAWFGQFYGHKVEGKKPSFFTDVQFLLIGPAWILSFVYKKTGLKL